MKVALIVCTYMRPKPLMRLLQSIQEQVLLPNEILIVDGSTNSDTALIIKSASFKNLNYFLVSPETRGLTQQRNFGLSKVAEDTEIIAFLDDDTELLPNYFEELIKTFMNDVEVSGVGGLAVNDNRWSQKVSSKKYNKKAYFLFEEYVCKEGKRNVLRNYLGLQSNLQPGKMPDYSHGRSCGLPMSGGVYEVDLLIGMSFAFRKRVFDSIQFSSYFEGYGLYEDADFSIRALQFGKNVINTKIQLNHYHDPSGRPSQYQYGKMVVRNGWYVWRTKNPSPELKDILRWHLITILLTLIRCSNVFIRAKRKEAFTEAFGRTIGWWSLFFNKPILKKV